MAGFLVCFGLAIRVLPLVQGQQMLLRQPTEDGYLMLTVARNIAIGLGMTSAAGTIPTNGVQPLTTFLDTACFVLAGGDKARGVAFVMALSVLIAVLGLLAVYRLACVIFSASPRGKDLAAIAAALWFVSPVVVAHSMNALETGQYLLLLAVTTRFFLTKAGDPLQDMRWRDTAVLGALLGLAFWARNDIILFLPAVTICRVASPEIFRVPARLFRRLSELAVTGIVMAVVASPWMISNFVRFGSIVPVSGKAEAAKEFGVNLPQLPAKMAEYLTITGAVPGTWEDRLPVQLACGTLLLAGLVAAVSIIRNGRGVVRMACLLGTVHALLLMTFYGAFFGAGHFLSRYLSPLSALCAFLTVGVGAAFLRRARWATALVPAALVLVAVVADARQYRHSRQHMHFQVVDWVHDNVQDDIWVGAVQTGTLGFFHDRTINLDGKVNVDALRAGAENRMRAYIVDSKIQYLADWIGIAGWGAWLSPTFRLVVDDPGKNLAVLHRVE